MIGGYSDDDPDEVKSAISILRQGNTLPAISCGFHPGLADAVTAEIGTDYLANVGGAVHGHPEGTKAGALAMRQALSGDHKQEYKSAVRKWGFVSSLLV